MNSLRYPWKRYLLANWRDTRVLLREFRWPLLGFTGSILLGGLLFKLLYTHSQVESLSYAEAVYTVFAMIFFEPIVPLPQLWYLQVFFFLMPIVGLAFIAQGIVNFGVALLNKKTREGEWQVSLASTYKDHVVVAGLGRLGFRIVQQLLKFNEDVVAIEIDPKTEFVQRVLDLKVPVILGDATHSTILRDAGVDRAGSLITCTENDLTNLEIALVARELKQDIRVVLRMFDDDMSPKIADKFDISSAFSTSALAAPAFAAAATIGEIRDTIHVGDYVLSFSELTIRPDTRLAGWRIENLERELDLSVIVHRRGERVDFHPGSEVALQAGDQIFVLATLDVLGRLRRMNTPRELPAGRNARRVG